MTALTLLLIFLLILGVVIFVLAVQYKIESVIIIIKKEKPHRSVKSALKSARPLRRRYESRSLLLWPKLKWFLRHSAGWLWAYLFRCFWADESESRVLPAAMRSASCPGNYVSPVASPLPFATKRASKSATMDWAFRMCNRSTTAPCSRNCTFTTITPSIQRNRSFHQQPAQLDFVCHQRLLQA